MHGVLATLYHSRVSQEKEGRRAGTTTDLEPRKLTEKALVVLILEVWIDGVPIRRVDDLVWP
ncbi:hypothetical protein AA0498_2425 [Acidomonas methanolica]|nr:hypothetical protein AA0498_2425 [Acidomonas methanolica]